MLLGHFLCPCFNSDAKPHPRLCFATEVPRQPRSHWLLGLRCWLLASKRLGCVPDALGINLGSAVMPFMLTLESNAHTQNRLVLPSPSKLMKITNG
jgi:hypothetical protein